MDLELQLRAAEARKADLERQHGDAMVALHECGPDFLEARQSHIRELEKKVSLEKVRCEELQLELASMHRSVLNKLSTTAPSNSFSGGGGSAVLGSNSSHSWTNSTALNALNKSAEIERIMAKIEQDNRVLAELEQTRSTLGGTTSSLIHTSTMTPSSYHPNSYINYGATATSSLYPSSGSSAAQSSRVHGINSNLLPGAYSSLLSSGGGSGGLHPTVTTTSTLSTVTFSNPLITSPFNALSLKMMGRGGLDEVLLTGGGGSVDNNNISSSSTHPIISGVTDLTPPPWSYTNSGAVSNLQLQPRLYDSPLPLLSAFDPPQPIVLTPPTQYATDRAIVAAGANLNNFNGQIVPFIDNNREMQVDMLDIPGKGRCSVYIARFAYEPESDLDELVLQAGDYVLVWNNSTNNGVDNGYIEAELLDGRRGLVPAHFIQRLIGEDLLEFHQAVLSTLREEELHQAEVAFAADVQRMQDLAQLQEPNPVDASADGDPTEVPAPRQLTLERQLHKSVLISWTAPEPGPGNHIDSYHVYVDSVLKATVKATERTRALIEGVDSSRPHRIGVRSVTVNRRTSRDAACTMIIGRDTHQLGPSAVRAHNITSTAATISWLPANSNHQHVVCVNNVEVRTVKPGVYRHTITGLTANTQYRVAVRAKHHHPQGQSVQGSGGHTSSSLPPPTAASSMMICGGSTATLDSDVLLLPSPIAATAFTDFRTLPKGLPDPPNLIQVEAGPQDGTVLVTWHPIAPAQHQGSVVTGYAVFADGKKVTDVDSPTGDHALIDISKLLSMNPRQVTVRTKARDGQSSDSVAAAIPISVLRGGPPGLGNQHLQQQIMRGPRTQEASAIPARLRQQQQQRQQVIDPEENLSDKEIFPTMGQQRHQVQPPPPIEETLPNRRIQQQQPMKSTILQQQQMVRPKEQQQYFQPSGGTILQQQQQQQQQQRLQQQQQQAPRLNRALHQQQQQQPQPPTKKPRWFVALFDYDPVSMSPNPESCEEELPFSEGDTIKVWGEKDNDGFYWGECHGRRGYVPHNMVMEVDGTRLGGGVVGGGGPAAASQPIIAATAGGRAAAATGEIQSYSMNRDRWGDIYANMPLKRMVALYDYDPQELSPNVDAEQVELSFTTGQLINVYGDMDDDGFYMGEIEGVRGLVPSNFLTDAPDQGGGDYGPQQQSRTSGQNRGIGPGARGPPPPPRDTQQMIRTGASGVGGGTTTTNLMGVGGRMERSSTQLNKDGCPPHSVLGPPYSDNNNISTTTTSQQQVFNNTPPTSTTTTTDFNQGRLGMGAGGAVTRLAGSSEFSGVGGGGGASSPQQRYYQKGVPQVVPTMGSTSTPTAAFSSGGLGGSTTTTTGGGPFGGVLGGSSSTTAGLGPSPQQQQGPNLMQKLNEITAPGGDILNKGKELIFMKFGLGGGK